MSTINCTAGIVLGATIAPVYQGTGATVVPCTTGLVLGASCLLQSQPQAAVEIPCTPGLYMGASLGMASVIPKPVTISCTAGVLLGVAAGLTGGLFIPTATPSDAPRPIDLEVPAAVSLLIGCSMGLVSNPPVAVEIPCSPGVLLGVSLGEVGEDYETWVLTGNLFNPSAYSNWPFNSFAQYRGNYYAAGDDGLHLLGGEDQAGIPIHPGVRLGPINFLTDRQKRLRSMRLGATGDEVQVRVATENNEGFFSKNGGDRVVVSRDIQGHDWTVDIQDFEELSFLEIVPLILSTK